MLNPDELLLQFGEAELEEWIQHTALGLQIYLSGAINQLPVDYEVRAVTAVLPSFAATAVTDQVSGAKAIQMAELVSRLLGEMVAGIVEQERQATAARQHKPGHA